jgi:hypothetical protein
MLTLVLISAVILVMVRSGGPAWLALALVALLLPLRWGNLRRLIADRSLRIATLVIAAASVLSVLWIVVMKASKLGGSPTPADWSPGQILVYELSRWPDLVNQLVGELGWLDVHLSGSAYLLWQWPAGALLVLAALVGRTVDRWRLLVLAGGAVGVSSVLDMLNANSAGGVVGQGRYLLPVLSGALLLAAWIISRGGTLTAAQSALAVRAIIVITLPIQLYALVVAEARYGRGIPSMPSVASFYPVPGPWHSYFGPITPLVVTTLGLLVVGAIFWRSAAVGWPAQQDRPGGAMTVHPRRSVEDVDAGVVPGDMAPVR